MRLNTARRAVTLRHTNDRRNVTDEKSKYGSLCGLLPRIHRAAGTLRTWPGRAKGSGGGSAEALRWRAAGRIHRGPERQGRRSTPASRSPKTLSIDELDSANRKARSFIAQRRFSCDPPAVGN